MRRILLILSLLCSLSLGAQHLKFKGIPLDGHISAFTARLKAKGFTVSPRSKDFERGLRVFRGIFKDVPVESFVLYDAATGTVFGANVQIPCASFRELLQLKEKITDELMEKYGNVMTWKENGRDYSETTVCLSGSNDKVIGRILVYTYREAEEFMLCIDWWDEANRSRYFSPGVLDAF